MPKGNHDDPYIKAIFTYMYYDKDNNNDRSDKLKILCLFVCLCVRVLWLAKL